MNKVPISVFDTFVSDKRKNFMKPFRLGDYIYATDTFIAIRCLASDIDGETIHNDSGLETEGFSRLFEVKGESKQIDISLWDRLLNTLRTEEEYQPRQVCPACDGGGLLECCECLSEYNCPKCDGSGEVGPLIPTGHMTHKEWNSINDLYIDMKVSIGATLLQKCIDLYKSLDDGSIKVYCTIPLKNEPILFEFIQNRLIVQIIIMPMNANISVEPKVNLPISPLLTIKSS